MVSRWVWFIIAISARAAISGSLGSSMRPMKSISTLGRGAADALGFPQMARDDLGGAAVALEHQIFAIGDVVVHRPARTPNFAAISASEVSSTPFSFNWRAASSSTRS